MNADKSSGTQELTNFFRAQWDNDERQFTAITSTEVGMIYELFSEPPRGMKDKDKTILKKINDLEAELIRLERKFLALDNAFSTIAFLSKITKFDEATKLSAVAGFAVGLGDYRKEVFDLILDSHKITGEIRSALNGEYY